MGTTNRKDPLPSFLFGLKITSLSLDYNDGTAFFKSVSGIKSETQVDDYPEGGITGFTRKVIGKTTWPNLVLKQGYTGGKALWNWRMSPQRVDGTIFMLGTTLKIVCQWDFKNGYPLKWAGPELDASKQEVAIETLEIAHEGLTLSWPGMPPPPEPPAPPPPPPAAPVNENVTFPTNGSTVPSPNAGLDAVADEMKQNPDKKIKIEGHTDSDGDAGYNKTLSQQRADAVKQYLLSKGVKTTQITSCVGYGEEQPIADNSTAAGKAQNRRTTVTDA
jgi:OOP family OmpA-OmpF porin